MRQKHVMRSCRPIVTVAICALLFALPLSSSKLSPQGTKYEQAVAKKYLPWWARVIASLTLRGLPLFTEPVHEDITNRIFGCTDDDAICRVPDMGFASSAVIAGVRWNDDPPFKLLPGEARHTHCKVAETIRITTQPQCWYELFRAAKKMAATGFVADGSNHAPLLARSHFGDLEFLHAMASRDGEVASETQHHTMIWAEFTWRVASGEYGLEKPLSEVPIPGFADFFGHSEWRVQDLFTQGNSALRPHIQDVAFGSLLHLIEDSFAKGHVERAHASPGLKCANAPDQAAPGAILEFHSYGHQDEKKHGLADSFAAFQAEQQQTPNVVDTGRVVYEFSKKSAPWSSVQPYLLCVFAIADPNAKASPGAEFAAE